VNLDGDQQKQKQNGFPVKKQVDIVLKSAVSAGTLLVLQDRYQDNEYNQY